MFRFAKDGRVRWPVDVDQVQEDGSVVTHTLIVTYVRLTRDHLKARGDEWLDISEKLEAMAPADGKASSITQQRERAALIQERINADDARLRAAVVDINGLGDQDGKTIPFSTELLDGLIADDLLRRLLLGGLIDASEGVRGKNSLPGLAGLPTPAQA